MSSSETPTSSSQALILTRSASKSPPRRSPLSILPASISGQGEQWHPILHVSNQVVLYNPHSHALSIASAPPNTAFAALTRPQNWAALTGNTTTLHPCPYCKQNLPEGFHGYPREERFQDPGSVDEVDDDEDRWETIIDDPTPEGEDEFELLSTDPAYHSRAINYFHLLAAANDASSQASGSRRSSLSPASRTGDDVQEERSDRRSRSDGKGRRRSPSPENYTSEAGAFPAEKMAEGYFKTFFQEEYRLGMGASGSVFLCQHVLDGNPLGHFAVKKIAVGESHAYLYKILKEVRLLERLRHPNIITYHHAWLETSRFSSFGPRVPTLFVLMQWAEGGSLDDFIDIRLGRKPAHDFLHNFYAPYSEILDPLDTPASTSPMSSNQEELSQENEDELAGTPTQTRLPETSGAKIRGVSPLSSSQATLHPTSNLRKEDPHSRSARIRAFRAYQRAPPEEKDRMQREVDDVTGGSAPVASSSVQGEGRTVGRKEWTAVHLLSADEVKSLFQDVVEGLGFLHSKSILHLDLKPGNVLLTWDEGRLIPRAMLSDFGTSRDMMHSSLKRSGNTGTLEYTAPESLPSPQTGLLQHINSKADMWSLGMILHKLLFFKLPYRYAADGDANGEPISQVVEGEKFARLEREVLAYSGFKCNPTMVTGFETRRLPRSFLVLLESLLNKLPSGRPSCERILTAVREGKFDPLLNIPSSKLPIARTWIADGSPPIVHAAPAVEESTFEQTTELSEKLHLLALPSPNEIIRSEEEGRQVWLKWQAFRTWLDLVYSSSTEKGRRERRKLAMTVMKLVRSSLLVAKVLTIQRVCPDPLTRPRSLLAAFLLALAVCDTVLDHKDWNNGREGRGNDHDGRKKEENPVQRKKAVIDAMSGVGSGIWVTAALTLFHFTLVGLTSISSGSNGDPDGFHELWSRVCCVEYLDR